MEAGGASLLVADTNTNRLRRIVLSGGGALALTVTTAAGQATAGFVAGWGKAVTTLLSAPWALAGPDAGGVVYTESANNAARRFTAAGWVEPLAGTGMSGGATGFASAATFTTPRGIAVAPNGAIFFSDTGNHAVKALLCPSASPTPSGSTGASASPTPTPSTSVTATPSPSPSASSSGRGCSVVTFAGEWGNAGVTAREGAPLAVGLNAPGALSLDVNSGLLYFTNSGAASVANSHDVRVVSADMGSVAVVSGNKNSRGRILAGRGLRRSV